MRALTWHGKRDVRVDTVNDPVLLEDTDAIIKVTTTAICGSDLHLYEVLSPFLDAGDILGHEPMGIVEEVGAAVTHIKRGDRMVIPFTVSCGYCFMWDMNLQSNIVRYMVTFNIAVLNKLSVTLAKLNIFQ